MPNFKPKQKKKIKANSKLNITLDSKHNEKIDEFENIRTVLIPQLQQEKLHYKNLLKDESLSLDKRLEVRQQWDGTGPLRMKAEGNTITLIHKIQF